MGRGQRDGTVNPSLSHKQNITFDCSHSHSQLRSIRVRMKNRPNPACVQTVVHEDTQVTRKVPNISKEGSLELSKVTNEEKNMKQNV